MNRPTIFTSDTFDSDERIVPFKEVYPLVKNFLRTFCQNNNLIYDGEKEITFKSTKIEIDLGFSSRVRRYFLTFFPKNIWEISYKSVLLPAFNETLEFFDKLPKEIVLGDVKFIKSEQTGEIDISDWKFSTEPDLGKSLIKEIQGTWEVKKLGSSMFNIKKGTITKKPVFINASGILNRLKLEKLKEKISPLFSNQPEIITEHDSVLETIDKRSDKKEIFVIFFGTPEKIEECYEKYKKYLISNDIPSQFVSTKDLEKNTLNWGFENLTFEILKKAEQKDSISLDVRICTNVDGFLCLADLGEVNNDKFFGISTSFSGDNTTKDWLEIYNDIEYTSNFDNIQFEEGELTKLGTKIRTLSNIEGKTIDVFVTRKWKAQDVGYICKILDKNNIKVRKFLYIGSKANRFLFSSLVDESNFIHKHPYIIWDEKAASIQTNSKIQLYGTMFPLYLELLNPWSNERIRQEDLEMILWLTKKRIYRIANFYSLKSPELIAMMKDARNLPINNISGKMRISLHALI